MTPPPPVIRRDVARQGVILFGLVALVLLATPAAAQGVPNAPIPGVAASAPTPGLAGQGQGASRSGPGRAVPPPIPALPSAPAAAPPAAPPQLVGGTEAAIDQQARGQFPAMERSPSLPLGTLQRSWDKPMPASGQTAPGVVHYMWHPDFIMVVRTRDFMITTLMLPAWERVNEYYVGDPVVFEAKRIRGNVVAVRSRNAGADSNLTVLGASGNVYNFYLRSETWNARQVSDLTVYVDAARPPDDHDAGAASFVDAAVPASVKEAASGAASEVPDYLRRILFRPEDLRFDMKMYARRPIDAEIAPERVFEDGVFTYFDFGERSDAILRPVVHQLVDGVDTVVNTRTAGPHGNILIAEAIGDFTLRNGNRVVCVRQAGRRPVPSDVQIGGDMPAPGTVAPAGIVPAAIRSPVLSTVPQ